MGRFPAITEAERGGVRMDTQAKLSRTRETVGEGKSLYQALGDSYVQVRKLEFAETVNYFVLDNAWRFVQFNGAVLDILQQSKSQLLQQVIWDVFPEAKENGVKSKLIQSSLDMMETHFEEYVKSLDKWLAFYAYPCDEGVIVYLNDISERKKKEQRLQMTQNIINNSPFVVFYIKATENWPVDLVTDNVYTLTGYTADEFYEGITFSDIIYYEDINRVRSNYANLLSNKKDPFTLEYRIITKDGTIKWVEEKALPEKNEQGQIVAYQSIIYAVSAKNNPDSKQVSIVYYDSIEKKNEDEELDKKKAIEQELRQAIKRHELGLIYQPVIASQTKRMDTVEAILVWHNSKLGTIQTEDIMPLAERIGMVEELEEWVLSNACQQLAQWQRMGLPSLKLEINLLSTDMDKEQSIQRVVRVLNQTELEPKSLQLNLPPTVLMYGSQVVTDTINAFKDLGVTVAVDFPVGDLSLRNLSSHHIDIIKIDKRFIERIAEAKNKKVISNVIKQGHKLGLQIVAEGVETKEQVEILKELNCDKQQGGYFSDPVPAQSITMYFDSYMSVLYKQTQ